MERSLRRFFWQNKKRKEKIGYEEKRESGTMKKLIKKIAIAILTGTIAFSVVPANVQAAGWKQNKNGYWWQENDYSYPKNQWKTIYGKQYHFNSSGYMDTGWQKIYGYDYYFGGANDGSLKTNIWVNGYYVDDSGRWTGQECYTYSNGEYLSEVSISHNQGEYSYLGFWHSYGESSSCEDFLFEWQNGKYEYTLQGGRSAAMFTVKFTPTAAGMRIQVTQQDGQGYSWIGGHTGNNNVKGQDWINAEYKKFNGKKGSGQ